MAISTRGSDIDAHREEYEAWGIKSITIEDQGSPEKNQERQMAIVRTLFRGRLMGSMGISVKDIVDYIDHKRRY